MASYKLGTGAPPEKFAVGLKSEITENVPLPFVRRGLLAGFVVLFDTVLLVPESITVAAPLKVSYIMLFLAILLAGAPLIGTEPHQDDAALTALRRQQITGVVVGLNVLRRITCASGTTVAGTAASADVH
jgi:hypothetical protein